VGLVGDSMEESIDFITQEHLNFVLFLCVHADSSADSSMLAWMVCSTGTSMLAWRVCKQPRVRKRAARHCFLGSPCRQASRALPPSVPCVAAEASRELSAKRHVRGASALSPRLQGHQPCALSIFLV
jgi:hypothetical protein